MSLMTLIVADHSSHTFSVEGPMSDDTTWTAAVAAAIHEAKNVSCTTGSENPRNEADEYMKLMRYTQVAKGSIVARPL
ncbi:hypothetical protein GCM10010136_31940 [Limoniibacter endophyticus]|uniref:Uncharacterized protein n=1 Tax=Limoniibacter endophyticus TaxID=1565040 RepID=A0A8J3DSC7_9HYPH|nr:hypothetical protein GCM10010136_31940 [Limoniibacter endophyticus]